jgi:hypothetical protein
MSGRRVCVCVHDGYDRHLEPRRLLPMRGCGQSVRVNSRLSSTSSQGPYTSSRRQTTTRLVRGRLLRSTLMGGGSCRL